MKTVKRLLIPMAALLVFSMLSTSVSAIKPDYYMASFYGEAGGRCWVYDVSKAEEYIGKGSVHVRGSAIVYSNFNYKVRRLTDPNTRLWTRRTRMTISWDNQKLKLWMWPSYAAWADIYLNEFGLADLGNLSYFGYYKGEAGLHFVSGTAEISLGPTSPILVLRVWLFVGTEHWLTFQWSSEEYCVYPAARYFIYAVTVWGPIPWHPSGP